MRDFLKIGEIASFFASFRAGGLKEQVALGRASCVLRQRRPRDWVPDPASGLLVPNLKLRDRFGNLRPPEDCWDRVGEDEKVWNLITNAGRDFLHTQSYGTSPGGNGLNYIAVSNDTVTETSSSTVLSNEITANGFARAQGTVTHTSGTNLTTINKVFTASGTQSCQKAALFSASSGGTMNHVLGFTQRSLANGDTFQVTFEITVG